MELANKKIRNRLQFSPEGLKEICGMHARLMDNLRLALNVFIAGDVKLARKLLEEKVAFRELERAASESHLARLSSEIGRASCRERVCQYVYISVVAVS